MGGPEVVIALVVLLLLFGPALLPKFARSLGQTQRELRNAFDEEDKKGR